MWCWQLLRTSTRWFVKAGLVGLLILFLAVTLGQQRAPAPAELQTQGDWETFDPVRLIELQRSGQPVLVNFTAAWCITCLVNEKVAISRPAVQAQLRQQGVVYMKADWTSKDPRITEMLNRYGRNGVPLYLLFPGNGQDAVVLPNILTVGILTDALQQVRDSRFRGNDE